MKTRVRILLVLREHRAGVTNFPLHTTVLSYAIWIHAGALRRIFLQEAESKGREEWMIVPPKSLGVLGALKTLNPTNRKFQT